MKKLAFMAFVLLSGAMYGQIFEGGAVLGPLTTIEINGIASPIEGQTANNSTTETVWAYLNGAWVDTGTGGSATTDASDLVSGVLADARVQESNVTQHEGAITITESQISDLTVTDGSETIVNAGTDISVSGSGTSGSPYIIGFSPSAAYALASELNLLLPLDGSRAMTGNLPMNNHQIQGIQQLRFSDTDSDTHQWTVQEITNGGYEGDFAIGHIGVYRHVFAQDGTATQPLHVLTKAAADALYGGGSGLPPFLSPHGSANKLNIFDNYSTNLMVLEFSDSENTLTSFDTGLYFDSAINAFVLKHSTGNLIDMRATSTNFSQPVTVPAQTYSASGDNDQAATKQFVREAMVAVGFDATYQANLGKVYPKEIPDGYITVADDFRQTSGTHRGKYTRLFYSGSAAISFTFNTAVPDSSSVAVQNQGTGSIKILADTGLSWRDHPNESPVLGAGVAALPERIGTELSIEGAVTWESNFLPPPNASNPNPELVTAYSISFPPNNEATSVSTDTGNPFRNSAEGNATIASVADSTNPYGATHVAEVTAGDASVNSTTGIDLTGLTELTTYEVYIAYKTNNGQQVEFGHYDGGTIPEVTGSASDWEVLTLTTDTAAGFTYTRLFVNVSDLVGDAGNKVQFLWSVKEQ